MATDETYFRKYLNDVTTVSQNTITEPSSYSAGETSDTSYFRKYLNDTIIVTQNHVSESDNQV
jgi:hypothetical protein